MRAAYKIREISTGRRGAAVALRWGQNVNEVYASRAGSTASMASIGHTSTSRQESGRSSGARAINRISTNGKLDREIDQALAKYSGDALVRGPSVWLRGGQPAHRSGRCGSPESAACGAVAHCAYEMLRWERAARTACCCPPLIRCGKTTCTRWTCCGTASVCVATPSASEDQYKRSTHVQRDDGEHPRPSPT